MAKGQHITLMQCPACGKEISKDWAICPNCGAALHNAAPPVFSMDRSERHSIVSYPDPLTQGSFSTQSERKVDLSRPSAKTQIGTFVALAAIVPLFISSYLAQSRVYLPYSYYFVVGLIVVVAAGLISNYLDPRSCVRCRHVHSPNALCGARAHRVRSIDGRQYCECVDYLPRRKGNID